ncbi:TadE/TadG family type IV pilus assembly protein [Cohaesibacter celericrescens]|uniref:VWFA domain-containing protein n=1 Tax=Cohaesibacter celericrescens TaxID=2067669 RepID=A0A2N5XL28_9HYPH|nr:TadE/TadG family type IV pilus assembly protein [Cohaesibacter celericrescens]PLW75241.1 hypothetical protein C0081_20720 [Cohaesibacter celericrescens]
MHGFAIPFLRHFKRAANAITKRPTIKNERSFASDESGAIAVIFAAVLIPIILMLGAAVDYSRIALTRSETQDAIDAATLAAVKKISQMTDSEVRSMIEAYVDANLSSSVSVNIDLVEIERNPSALKVWASGSTDTTFMRIAGINTSDFKANSSAVASDKSIEVALVLDNSGSMSGSRITALKEAATSLVDILEENQQNTEDLSIGVVPFNHLVRVDTDSADDTSWLDLDVKTSIHRNNLPTNSNRFDLFETLKDPYTGKSEEWEGCVEARMHPYDIKDTAPNDSFKESYFLPFFYPDTREHFDNQYNSYNSYLPNSVSKNSPSKSIWKEFGEYYQQTFTKNRGPNYSCYVKRLLPMTTNMDAVRTHISGLGASGNTNIHLGTIWGLRILSPQAPYTQGRSHSDDENVKFLIVMSDGANTYSRYQAYGWSNDGRISGASSTVKEMNNRTLEACSAAKSEGVIVYTIAYGNVGSSTTTMMQNCATLPANAFTPQTTSDMVAVFKEIAAALNTIRLTD